MTYEQMALLHLVTIFPAFLIGTWLLFRRKGSSLHRVLGKAYMLLVLFSVIVSLFMSARVGPSVFGHFGFIHLLSFQALFAVIVAWRAIQAKDVRRHRNAMIGLYVGGMMIAGSFALMPGRLLHAWFFA